MHCLFGGLALGRDHWFEGSDLSDAPEPAAGPVSDDDSDFVYLGVQFRI